MDMKDPALAERLRHHKTNRLRLTDEMALDSGAEIPGKMSVTSAKIDRLSAVTQDALKTGSIEFRRSYLRMFVGRATVSRREVRISGPKAALAKAASSDVPAPGPGVLSFIREWRPLRDSNPRCRRERAVSWASRRRGHRSGRAF
jgi:site-specific DNA recombinase